MVCGQVIGYQFGGTDAFNRGSGTNLNEITLAYVDGVSLTHGNFSTHIWTFASGSSGSSNGAYNCPCSSIMGVAAPSFVGTDYFCDSGNQNNIAPSGVFFGDDPLWDGAGCGPQSTCCSFNNPPWFYKQLPQPTTDGIEMRVCRDQGAGDEDISIEIVEIYVQ